MLQCVVLTLMLVLLHDALVPSGLGGKGMVLSNHSHIFHASNFSPASKYSPLKTSLNSPGGAWMTKLAAMRTCTQKVDTG